MRLLPKYFASGTVAQISIKGCRVKLVGSHWNAPCTSTNGFIAEVIMTYSGATVKIISGTSTTHRAIWHERSSRITVHPPVPERPPTCDHDEEEHKKHRHRRSEPKIPLDERASIRSE